MMDKTMSDTTMVLRRTFKAPREEVFSLWSTAEGLRAWYAYSDTWETTRVEVDLRVGGTYRIDWRVADKHFGESGEYLEVSPFDVLAYTVSMAGAGDADLERTVCRVEFTALDERTTEVLIVEEGYPDKESRDMHASGWPSFLDRLERLL